MSIKNQFTQSLVRSKVIAKRELHSYFATPLAYIFIVIFLALSGFFTFEIGSFFARGQADLQSFFNFHPIFYVMLAPALAMRLWAEERSTGTIELLMTQPINTFDAVLGKFLAAWVFAGIALLLTFPLWITVNYLGSPDNGVVAASYIGSWLMMGAFLAVGSCMSALTRNQVIAFVLTICLCLFFVMLGMPVVLKFFYLWLPASAIDKIANLSFITHYQSISRGVLDLRDFIFFSFFIGSWLAATTLVINIKKSH